MQLVDEGYSGTGIQVASRNQKWQGLSQIIDASLFTASAYVGKVFVQVAENTTEDVRYEIMAAKLLTADGTTQAGFQIDAFISACDWLMLLMRQSYWLASI